eukprot:Protomagalhaensia_sp_Gyna_25__4108@NODE_371_length_3667_cov_108_092613_g285_i0_p2_GENE_NODE_371_length_3667_cov_108_092613_g285_i0NODE_371_length_3667_cov_108_092613_g285_i0_p2_ORF_typecomplete_len451_score75_03Taxilin/PF09728_9/6_3e06Taxilin/PF09728_9/5_4Taxilin/PF09728_9/5_2e02MAD/PF05557_13/4_8e05HOOK/PF05622_12/0_12HOOK/PF05622_12/1_2HAUSaugmin3/PF14932_6/2_2e02HAUSaugmin3/PF14932_6/1_5e03HAUSaugmin3/PF14932_6/0_0027HAUSaugmin3/PF14932_6/28Spc29/PF17082_5/2_4e03Spc29/PF17082_5/0_0028Spc29/PF
MSGRSAEDYRARIQELEQNNTALASRLEVYDTKVQTEFLKIRDKWDCLKAENQQLRDRLAQQNEHISIAQQQASLISSYKRELYEKERTLQAQHERIRALEKAERQLHLHTLQQKRIDDLHEQLDHLVRQKEDADAQCSQYRREVQEWRRVAAAYCDTDGTGGMPIELETFQSRLVEDNAMNNRLEMEHSAMTMELGKEQKLHKDAVQRARALERDLRHSALEIDELQRALQQSKENESRLSSQIGVLKRCIAKQLDASSSDSNPVSMDQSPFTEPSKTEELCNDPVVRHLQTQLAERREEIDSLRRELEQAESGLAKVNEMELEIQGLRSQLAKTSNIKNQLITKMQKLQVTGARSTSSNSIDGDSARTCECGATEGIQKVKEAAYRRADNAKREAKLQREVTALLVQKVLGWTFNFVEAISSLSSYRVYSHLRVMVDGFRFKLTRMML